MNYVDLCLLALNAVMMDGLDDLLCQGEAQLGVPPHPFAGVGYRLLSDVHCPNLCHFLFLGILGVALSTSACLYYELVCQAVL